MGCGQSQVGIAPRSDDNRPTDKPASVPGTPTKVSVERPRSKTIKVKENDTPVGSPVLLKVRNNTHLCSFLKNLKKKIVSNSISFHEFFIYVPKISRSLRLFIRFFCQRLL